MRYFPPVSGAAGLLGFQLKVSRLGQAWPASPADSAGVASRYHHRPRKLVVACQFVHVRRDVRTRAAQVRARPREAVTPFLIRNNATSRVWRGFLTFSNATSGMFVAFRKVVLVPAAVGLLRCCVSETPSVAR